MNSRCGSSLGCAPCARPICLRVHGTRRLVLALSTPIGAVFIHTYGVAVSQFVLESSTDPLRVVVTRDVVESEHLVDVAVIHGSERITLGDAERGVIPRSSIKPIQVLPLIESGAADRFAVSDVEVALGAASHSGEPAHVEAVDAWLARIGLNRDALECGDDRPISVDAADALLGSGTPFEAIHNCCSGKHAAFLTIAQHLGVDPAGYIEREHPVQQLVTASIERYTGRDLAVQSSGIDGCGIPTFSLPLDSLADAMQRLATGDDTAAKRVTTALVGNAFWISGSHRLEHRFEQACSEPLILKAGAEGVYMGALPARGIGIALKVRDGAKRGAEAAIAFVLAGLGAIDPAESATDITNKAGTVVGTMEAQLP